MFCLPLIKVVQHMNHGSVADELSLGGKIPANSNSVFTSRQSPFSAPAIARSAFCNSRRWVAEGREEEGILGASGGWVAGEGAFGCGSGGVGAAQDSFADEGGLARSDLLSGKDPLADEGVRPTSGSFVGEGSAGEDGSGCGSGSVATTQDSFADEGVRATRASLAGVGARPTQDSLAGEGARPTQDSLAGEGARPTFPTLASLKSEGDQASSPMMRSGTRNRSTVT